MARPRKVGLDYFSHDVDASADDKVRAIEMKFGPAGYTLYFKTLERIYKSGGSIQYPGVFRGIMAYTLRITEEDLDGMIEYAVGIELLHRNSDGSITSNGAEKRRNFVEKERETDRERKSGSSPEFSAGIRPKEKETKGNKRKGSDPALPLSGDSEIIQRVIDHLNATAGKRYRLGDATRKIIGARLKEGFTEADLKTVIEKKSAGWKDDDKMEKYLRPETLFQASKFDGYLNEPWPKAKGAIQTNGFQRNRIDPGIRPDLEFIPTGTN